MKSLIIIALTSSILLTMCVSKQQKENTLSFSGAFALYPMAVKWSEEYKKENEGIRFNISAGGAGKGMTDALAGTVDLGMFSREISQEEKDKGVWWVGLCKDAVLPTISSNCPYLGEIKKKGMTKEEFEKIFIHGIIKNWKEIIPTAATSDIHVYTRSDACGAAGTWAKYLGGNQEDINGIGIHGDPGLAEAVSNDKTGIGFNNTAYVYDINTGNKNPGIEVIPIDLNSNGKIDPNEDFYDSFDQILEAIALGNYPSPPARELYFVAKGKPKKNSVLNFIHWALTDGQQYIKEAGYVPLTIDKINQYIDKIK